MKRNEWITIIILMIVIAAVVAYVTGAITGNVININQDKRGAYQVYTKAEIDSGLKFIQLIDNTSAVGYSTLITPAEMSISTKTNLSNLIEPSAYRLTSKRPDGSVRSLFMSAEGGIVLASQRYAGIKVGDSNKNYYTSIYGGQIIMTSSNGKRWLCGPNDAGNWTCSSTSSF